MTRVALLPSAYLPDLGGVEEMCHNLALTLREQGDQVEVWTAKVPAVGPAVLDTIDGIVVRRFPFALPAARPASLAGFPLTALKTVGSLRAAFREFRPEVANVHCFGPNGVYATALAPLTRTPLVVTLHGETLTNDHAAYDRSAVLRQALRHAMRHASAVTGCSQFALDDAVDRFGLDPKRGRVIFNGINLAEPASPSGPVTERAESPNTQDVQPLTILAMGRMVPNKGFDLLLRAFAQVASDRPRAMLVLAGDGAFRTDLEAMATELGVADRVHFTGRLDRVEVAAALSSADVYALTSRLESFGLVILEGWRAGVPVIATNRGGPPEFVTDGVDGLLVDPTDSEALAATLSRLLDDAVLRQRIGTAGLHSVERFGWPQVAQRYRQVYADVLAPSSS